MTTMTTPTSPLPPITGPKPSPFPLSDPLAALIDDAMQFVAKILPYLPGASATGAPLVVTLGAVLTDIVQGLAVAGPLVSPLDSAMTARLATLRGYFVAGDLVSLIAWYNDEPLHPNLSRWFAWFYLRLSGVAV
jgi:hypothetical protein